MIKKILYPDGFSFGSDIEKCKKIVKMNPPFDYDNVPSLKMGSGISKNVKFSVKYSLLRLFSGSGI